MRIRGIRGLSALCLLGLLLTTAPNALAGKRHRKITEGRNPAVSPDGLSVAFVREDRGNTDVWIVGIDGKDARRLTKSPHSDSEPAWSPDGQHIVFSSRRSGQGDLYVMRADGTEPPVRLTSRKGAEAQPDWSPDGELIAFEFAGERGQTLGLIPARGGELIVFDPFPDLEESDPCFSPDGARLAMMVHGYDDDPDLAVVALATEGEAPDNRRHRLRETREYSPSWNPVTAQLAFTSDREQSNSRAIANEPPPAIEPDPRFGRRGPVREQRAGVDARPELRTVYGISASFLGLVQYTTRPYDVTHPDWTPDGRSIVYVREGRMQRAPGLAGEIRKLREPEIWIREKVHKP